MKTNRISFKSLALGACALGALMSAAQAHAAEFAVAPQSLSEALQQFAKQGDQQVLFSSSAVAGKKTAGFSGEAAPELALNQLLAGTGLTWSKTSDGAILIAPPEGGSPQGASAAGGGAEVEELVVTAQKREENIQDVPIAISAFTQEALEAQKIEGGFDLLKAIPNVTFSKNNFTSYNFSIRGIGTKAISPTTDPGVAVEFNETPMIRNRLFEQEYFDVERVEVLRGPQGTLHGRNATSGVINVISAKPQLDEFEGSAKIEVGNYNSRRVVGMVNVPIVEDVLGIRMAGAMTKRDGYGLNLYDNSDADDRDLWSLRTTIGFEPNDRIRADLIWERFEEDDARQRTGKQLCTHDEGLEYIGNRKIEGRVGIQPLAQARGVFSQGCLPGSLYDDAAFGTPNGFAIPFISALAQNSVGPVGWNVEEDRLVNAIELGVDPYGNTRQSRDLRAFYSQLPSVYRAKADVIELNFSVDVSDSLTFTSLTAYNKDEYYASQDFNRYTTLPAFTDTTGLIQFSGNTDPSYFVDLSPGGFFCDPQLGCSNTIVGQDVSRADSEQFSQEFRLQSDFDGPVNFSFGANYTDYQTVEDYYVFFNGITMASIVAINGGFFGSKAPDRLSTNPDCTYVPPGAGGFCVPIETNSIENIQDYGHNYFLSRNPYQLTSKAAFGELYWSLTEAMKVTVGLRYTDDEKTFTPIPSQTALTPRQYAEAAGAPGWIPLAVTGTGFGYPAEPDVVLGWQEFTGRVGIDWKPDLSFTDDTLLYAFASRGYKGGGMNPPPVGLNYEEAAEIGINYAESAPPFFEPEFVNALEVGSKNTLLGGAVILNLGAFYYDYKDYQVSKIVDRSAFNENFDATIWGLELESLFSPTRNLRFNLNLGYLDTELAEGSQSIDLMNRTAGNPDWVTIKPSIILMSNCVAPVDVVNQLDDLYGETLAALCPGGNLVGRNYAGLGQFGTSLPGGGFFNPATDAPNGGAGFYTDIGGNELPNAPHWTTNVGAQYQRELPAGWEATLRGDFYWQSQSFHRVYNTQYDKLHAWSNLNLSLWFEHAEWGLKAEVYVKNVLDETPITDAFLNSDDSALTTNIFTLDPRLVGLSVRKEF
ncbi:MAG TPA: TonB-dependent receptor [Caulobacteraceae bacterium]|nr:TonB-dependent receptor [Caulobacteraceae bacterium]